MWNIYIFKKENIKNIVELGPGLGRDTIFFAKNSIFVNALDYSSSAVRIINDKAKKLNLSKFISAKKFDVRQKLPFNNSSVKGFFSHMLYCMALTNSDLQNLNNEIYRVLAPQGLNIYTVRHTDDGDYKNGIYRGEELYENDGFIVHYFSKEKIEELSKGFENLSIEKFEEGSFPRKLFFVINKRIIWKIILTL